MSRIAYDPVKDRFANIIDNSRFLRTLFYLLLDLFFLRGWHVRGVMKRYTSKLDKQGSWRLLDAGSGFGQYDRFMLKEFAHVRIDAVDVKDDYLQACKSYFSNESRIGFSKADVVEMDLEPQYDFVLCVDVLEHIEEDVQVMKNAAAGLKEGGYFLMHSPSHYAEEDAGEDESFVDEHARAGYSKEDLSDKLQQAGLKVVEMEYTYGKYGHASWVTLIRNPMLWFTKWGMKAAPLVVLYYIITLIPGLVLMKMDMWAHNEKGTGIYALARK